MVDRRQTSSRANRGPRLAQPGSSPRNRAREPLPARVLSLQRSAGNRYVTKLVAGSRSARISAPSSSAARMLARDVESDQVAEVAKTAAAIKDSAAAAKAATGTERSRKVKQLTADFVRAFVPETRDKVSRCEYDPKTKGFAVKDVAERGTPADSTAKQGWGTIVAGDDVVERAAAGKVSELGEELRGAVAQIHAVDLRAGRAAIVWIGRERVRVSSIAEKAEAERIVRDLPAKFGIDLDSIGARRATRGAHRKFYMNDLDTVLKGVDVSPWEHKELQALERAVLHFAPILGEARKRSSLASSKQEVTTVGKLTAGVDSVHERLATHTIGSFSPSEATYAMYATGTDAAQDFGTDNAKQLEGTAVHELAHGLFKQHENAFVRALDYWDSGGVMSGKRGAEAPPTKRGAVSAAEDLTESVMLFFVDPERLKRGDGTAKGSPGNPCRKRFAFVERVVAGWIPAVKPAKPR